MASPEPEREPRDARDMGEAKSKPDIRDAKFEIIHADLAEIKSLQIAQNAKLDIIHAGLIAIKARQDALAAKLDKHHAHMYRLLYTLLAAAVIALLMFAREAFF